MWFIIRLASLGLLASQMAWAGQGIASCVDSWIDLRSVQAGFRCKTRSGAVFVRVSHPGLGEAWMEPDGTIWSDEIPGAFTQAQAVQACEAIGGFLPARVDFLRGERQDFREVLPLMSGMSYWTATLGGEDAPDSAYVYSGQDGSTELIPVDALQAVRCLAR